MDAVRVHKTQTRCKGATIMTNLMKYQAADLPALLERINRNAIGMDEYFDRIFKIHETTSNYPPYNLVQVSNVESRETQLDLMNILTVYSIFTKLQRTILHIT